MKQREQFSTTKWSMVLAAAAASDPRSREALASLCESYWYPLYVFIRRLGQDPDQALDLTQGFFLELVEKQVLEAARPDLGKFRSFLLGALKNFLAHEQRKERTKKRGGTTRIVSLDGEDAERRYLREPRDDRTPEKTYERKWASTVVALAGRRLEQEMTQEGKTDLFRRLGGSLSGERPDAPYRKIADELGTTEAAVKMAMRRLRQRFGQLLRDEIAHTVQDPAAVDDELRYLLTVARGA